MPNYVKNRLRILSGDYEKIFDTVSAVDEDGEEKSLDFNKIIPMPESLNIEKGSSTDAAIELYLTHINPDIDFCGQDMKISPDAFTETLYILGRNESGFVRQIKGENYPGICQYRRDLSETEINERLAGFMKENKSLDDVLGIGKQAVDNVRNYGAMDWYDFRVRWWGTKWGSIDGYIEGNAAEFDTAWSPPMPIIEKLSEMFPDAVFEFDYAEEQTGLYSGHYIFQNGEVLDGGDFEEESKEAYEKHFELWGSNFGYIFNEKTGTYEYPDDENENTSGGMEM